VLIVGGAAEQVVRRRAWITAYVATGLVGQLFGQAWQPVGAGNSVAVCGLAALAGVRRGGLLRGLHGRPADGPGPARRRPGGGPVGRSSPTRHNLVRDRRGHAGGCLKVGDRLLLSPTIDIL